MYVLGLDVGGANTKATLIRTSEGSLRDSKSEVAYFPIWKRGIEELPNVLEALRTKLMGSRTPHGVGVTMTAELSDAYGTKREGVNHILDCAERVFSDTPILVLDVEANLISVEEARRRPLRVAAANWAATGWMASNLFRNCIVVDVGSTTTSIIPVVEGRIAAAGKTDLEKLLNGELVYTGALRTSVAAIVDSIPIRDGKARVSSELFALSGDVHLILGNLGEEDYTTETADGRGKTRREAMARLARVVCADIETLTEGEILAVAQHISAAQVEQIAEALNQVYDRTSLGPKGEVWIVVTGVGKDFLARRAAGRAGFGRIVDLGKLMGRDAAIASPSFGVALMAASRLQGRRVAYGGRGEVWGKPR
ncbi:MAG: hydantoinase/oxoprolinase family protein [Candidatus Geothermarchaeales archaeon]